MADTIPTHYATEFHANWISRLQQTKCRLDAYIDWDDFQGERKRYDRMAAQSFQERTERKGPTRITETPNDFRWAYRKSYDLANMLDEDDAMNLAPLALPTSRYVTDHTSAYHRLCDDTAVAAASGSVYTGEAGSTVTAFPAGQVIAHGGTGLTLTKLLLAREILEDADYEDGTAQVIVVSSEQITNLLNTTEVKSADYNTVKALAAGQVDTFMGFKFIKNLRLPKVSTTRTCVGWVKGSIILSRGNISTKIVTRDDLSGAIQVRSTAHLSKTRVHDEGVFTIECTEV
jgi:hypothetical protein